MQLQPSKGRSGHFRGKLAAESIDESVDELVDGSVDESANKSADEPVAKPRVPGRLNLSAYRVRQAIATLFGRSDERGRGSEPSLATDAQSKRCGRKPDQEDPISLLLVGADAKASDATLQLLALGSVLSRELDINVQFLLKRGGRLLPRFMDLASTTLLDTHCPDGQADWFRACGSSQAILISCATGDLLEDAQLAGISCIILAHETSAIVQEDCLQPQVSDIAYLAQHVVFPSETVLADFQSREPVIRGSVNVYPPGLGVSSQMPDEVRLVFRDLLGLTDADRLVLGTGKGNERSGFDHFVLAAKRLCATDERVHFCWTGRLSRNMKRWYRSVRSHQLKSRLHLIDDAVNVESWIAAADCLYLSARLDSCPRCVVLAVNHGKPVVMHAGTTGFDNAMLALLVQTDINDHQAIDEAISRALFMDSPQLAQQRQNRIREQNSSLRDYALRLLLLAYPASV